MSKYQDFIKNYLKEAENNETLQKVRNFIATGKVDGKFSDLLNKLSDEDFKSIFDKNFKNYFVNKHKFAFNIGKEQPYLIDFVEDRHDSEKKPVIDEMIAIFSNKIEGDGIKKFKAASGITDKEFEDIFKKFLEKSRWTFSSALSEYEQLGKILTYRSIDVIYKLGEKENIPLKDVQYALRNAFKTEKLDYLKKLEKIDTKMLVDAVAGVKENLTKRQESTEVKYAYTLNEADATEIEQMDLKQFFDQAYSQKNDDAIKNWLKPFINDHQEDVESNKKTIQARFEKGRKEIIEKEKSDKEQDFTDPVTGTVEKRVGRLGNFGPMTYIKNHEDLNKAIEAIDKQKWNIFNCAAKLLIKFFKVIEHGEKKWQEFLNDQRSAKKDIETYINNKKQKDFNSDYDEILNDSNRIKNEKYYDIIREYSANVMKYENDFITPFNNIRKQQLITVKDNKFYINQNTKDYINTVKHNLANVMLGYDKAMEALNALDNGKDPAQKEEQQQEAPQQTASYKPVYNNQIIGEAGEDKANANTADAVRDAGEEAKKKNDNQSKQDDKKKENEKIDWKNTKFNFYFPESIEFGEMEKYYNDGAVKNYANVLQEISKSIEDKNLKVVLEAFGKLTLLFDSKSNNPRLLNNDEVITNTITAGQLFEKSKALFDSVKQIADIPEFADVEIGNIDELRQKYGEQIKQITNMSEFFNDTIILAIGQEKKEEPSKEDGAIQRELKNMIQIAAGISKTVDNTDKNTLKKAVEDIKKRKEEVVNKILTYFKNKPVKNGDQLAKALKDPELDAGIVKYIHPDKNESIKNLPVIECIWTCISFLKKIGGITSKYKLYENELEQQKEDAIKLINDCIPTDENSKIYLKKLVDWKKQEYAAFIAKVNEMAKVIIESKDKLTEEVLKPIGKSADELVNDLSNEETDPLLKLELISGLIIDEEEKKEETNQENSENKDQDKTQEQGDNSNSGDTKAIGQDVSSKVPTKAEEKKEESFSNELAEDLYKYLRG